MSPRKERLLSISIKPAEFAARRQQLCQTLGHQALAIIPAATLVTRNNDVHYPFRQQSDFLYLTGFPEADALAVFIGGSPGAFILFTQPRDAVVERWDGARIGPEGACQSYGADHAYSLDEFDKIFPDLLAQCDTIYTAFDRDLQHVAPWLKKLSSHIRSGIRAPWQVADLNQVLHEQRLIKSPSEINLMQHAADVSSAAHMAVMQSCQPGCFEYELFAEFNYVLAKHGCLHQAYDAIVAAGQNACVLHYTAKQALCQEGDLMLVDAGAEFQHYAADITRCFPVSGRFSEPQRLVYEAVLRAQAAAIDIIQPGVRWQAVSDVVTRVICEGLLDIGLLQGSLEDCLQQERYRNFYMHSFGHWLGMDVHDVGRYQQQGQWRSLQPGMVLTVEPGIYINPAPEIDPKWWGIGVRIEDDILVTEDGKRSLSTVPKTVVEIEDIMHG